MASPASTTQPRADAVAQLIFEPTSKPVGDAIFLFINSAGLPGELSDALRSLDLSESDILPDAKTLQAGYAIVASANRLICFVVTLGPRDTARGFRRNLRKALSDNRLARSLQLWIPLMGAGAGNLSLDESCIIVLEALKQTGWLVRENIRIIVASPPDARWSPPRHALDLLAPQPPVQKPSSPELQPPPAAPTLSAAARAALDLAAAMRPGHKASSISTTLLLFALAQSPEGPPALAGDPAASMFSGAIHALAARRFQDAWTHYFSDDFTVPKSVPPADQVRHTHNVVQVLQEAGSAARERGNGPIEVDDLIVSLLSNPAYHHFESLSRMGIEAAALLGAYRDALTGEIGKKLFSDVAEAEDKLGYDDYAAAIYEFLIDKSTQSPLSISIQAPWGAGKSSLMHQIRERLDPALERTSARRLSGLTYLGSQLKDVVEVLDGLRKAEPIPPSDPTRRWTVWFNAWKYDSTEQLWAGLVDAIVSQVSDRLSLVERELFLLRLQLSRIDGEVVRRKIYDRVVTLWWSRIRSWSIAGIGVVATLLGLQHSDSLFSPELASRLQWCGPTSIAVLAAYIVSMYFASRKKADAEPAAFSLAEYLQVPDYKLGVGSVHRVHKDLMRILSVMPRNEDEPYPLVIFIDDLDRCSPSKVASVVEGVSMFLASDEFQCMFVIGMDPQMIAAALEEAHAKVREQLPRYERTVPLGWRFMDKFIQLPFTIPPASPTSLKDYVRYVSDATPPSMPLPLHDEASARAFRDAAALMDSAAELRARPRPNGPSSGSAPIRPTPDEPAETARVTRAVQSFKESLDVGRIIEAAADATSGNPREIKRIANLARLYLRLRDARRKREATWRSPALRQYARWIVLTLRWPEVMRWLLWGADEATWTAEESAKPLPVRRLQIIESQGSLETAAEWATALASKLNLPAQQKGDWTQDPKLFEFFQMKRSSEVDQKLSAALLTGFW